MWRAVKINGERWRSEERQSEMVTRRQEERQKSAHGEQKRNMGKVEGGQKRERGRGRRVWG